MSGHSLLWASWEVMSTLRSHPGRALGHRAAAWSALSRKVSMLRRGSSVHGQRKQVQAPRVKREVSARVASPAGWRCAHRGPGCPLQPECFGTESLEDKNGQGECLEHSQCPAPEPRHRSGVDRMPQTRGSRRGDASEVHCPGKAVRCEPGWAARLHAGVGTRVPLSGRLQNRCEHWGSWPGRGRQCLFVLEPSPLLSCLVHPLQLVFG